MKWIYRIRNRMTASHEMIFITCLLFVYFSVGSSKVEYMASVNKYADKFGGKLRNLTRDVTAYNSLRTIYEQNQTKFSDYSGKTTNNESVTRYLNKTVQEIENLLRQKVNALKDLVKVAEDSSQAHLYRRNLDIEYLNNKKLLSDKDLIEMGINMSDPTKVSKYRFIPFEDNSRFNNIPVNFYNSTIHVPTNVFDKAPQIENGVLWSRNLNPQFRENHKRDIDLTWQYFCSSDGFLRIYPGLKWPRDNKDGNIDMYECRVRNWYIQAASSPKNIIILVDTSGSMKGLCMEITRNTIEKLLDTFSDDDYFNIIQYSDEPKYIDDCFNGTMLQANSENKDRMMGIVKNLKMKNNAKLELALVEAFNLFEMEEERRGELCNKAIMLITDGAQETYEKIFDKYNWPNKTVRVFSFLIGREVSDNRYAKWMACANKGYYTHIFTIADVQESIQYYLRVLSRPMVIQRAENIVWTLMYADYTTEVSKNLEGGLGFVVSVAMPVHDLRNNSEKARNPLVGYRHAELKKTKPTTNSTKKNQLEDGHMLGVMGIDIPINQIKDLIPYDRISPNGYAFLLTRHGYVVFHPRLKPTFINNDDERELRLGYNNIDLTEIEFVTDRERLKKLKHDMLGDSKFGHVTLQSIVPYEDLKRVVVTNYTYYYAKIKNADFSLGIAIPTKYGHYYPSLGIARAKPNVSLFDRANLAIAPWRFCGSDEVMHLKGTARIQLLHRLFNEDGNKKCDDNLLTVYELMLINPESEWVSMSHRLHCKSKFVYPCDMDSFYKEQGIEMLFLGTRGGLTFYKKTGTESDLFDFGKDNKTVESTYFKRAVEGIEEFGINYIFSIPLDKKHTEADLNSTLVTATMPITPYSGSTNAVVAMLMKYEKFKERFSEHFEPRCKRGHSCFSCHSGSGYNCFLLDNNGYIILSNGNASDIGSFLDDHKMGKGLMSEMVRRGVYHKVQFADYQDTCDVMPNNGFGSGDNAAEFLSNPFKKMFNMIFWMITEMALFVSEFGIRSWFFHSQQAPAMAQKNCEIALETVRQGKIEQKAIPFYLYHLNPNCKVKMEQEQCHTVRTLYYTDFKVFKQSPHPYPYTISGVIHGCSINCNRTYVVRWIEDTNLIFLAAPANCDCTYIGEAESTKKERIHYDRFPGMACDRLKEKLKETRTRTSCYDHSSKEDDTHCGEAGCIFSTPVILLTVLLSMLFIEEWTS